MLDIRLICVGKLKEDFYKKACMEYQKRLCAYCRIETVELAEAMIPERPSAAQIGGALSREGASVLGAIPAGAYVTALCVEGRQMDSAAFARHIGETAARGGSRMCFVIGGSNGLSDAVKARADCKLSLSEMTLPHHLARVVVLEQLYRAFNINAGGRYHK